MGTTAERKSLQKMIEDAKANKFDVILAKELSRLAHNSELSYQIKNLCENQGIHIRQCHKYLKINQYAKGPKTKVH